MVHRGFFIVLLLIAVSLIQGDEQDGLDRNLRAWKTLFNLKRGIDRPSEEKRGSGCHALNHPCGIKTMKKCCGSTVCYWPDGMNPLRLGMCVTCVSPGLSCYRDGQCCNNGKCNKERWYHVNGVCSL